MLPPLLLHDLNLARDGDRQAMERLLAALGPHLESLARRYAEPGAQESVADLVQEAAVRIWQKLAQFQGGEDEQTAAMFHDWLSQLVRNLALDRQRERHAQRREPPGGVLPLQAAGTSEAQPPEPPAAGPTPSANARTEEQANLIRAALDNLPQVVDREIMRLCFFEGLSLRQIADRLQLSYDKVRERYHHSLRVLERELRGLL